MMMSNSAARIGRNSVSWSLTGKSLIGSRRALLTSSKPSPAALLGGGEKDIWTPLRLRGSAKWNPPLRRWKSSRVATAYDEFDSDGDDLEVRTKGLAAAAELRATEKLSHEEAWMINLGRGTDNEWLTGPREDEWFTGRHPRDCPGKLPFPLLASHLLSSDLFQK